jgi:hypothetical protein
MYVIKLSKKENGSLSFSTTNPMGRLVNITNEIRAKLINKQELIKNKNPIYNNLYICTHPMIIPMAKLEDETVDAIFIKWENKQIIVVHEDCQVYWFNKLVQLN